MTDRQLLELVKDGEDMLRVPFSGTAETRRVYSWRHINSGKKYVVLGVVLVPGEGDPVHMVRYHAYSKTAGRLVEWVRPIRDFLQKFEPWYKHD